MRLKSHAFSAVIIRVFIGNMVFQAREQLEQAGHEREADAKEIGNVNSIQFDEDKGIYVGAADSSREGMAIDLSSASIDYLQTLVEQFDRFDEITDDATKLLKTHLKAIDHFEDTGEKEKATKHLHGFQELIKKQHKEEIISDQAYETLKTNVSDLLKVNMRQPAGGKVRPLKKL